MRDGCLHRRERIAASWVASGEVAVRSRFLSGIDPLESVTTRAICATSSKRTTQTPAFPQVGAIDQRLALVTSLSAPASRGPRTSRPAVSVRARRIGRANAHPAAQLAQRDRQVFQPAMQCCDAEHGLGGPHVGCQGPVACRGLQGDGAHRRSRGLYVFAAAFRPAPGYSGVLPRSKPGDAFQQCPAAAVVCLDPGLAAGVMAGCTDAPIGADDHGGAAVFDVAGRRLD